MPGQPYILREITPLTPENCFIYISRTKKEFTYPIHTHPEYELNFIENAKGVKRIVGDCIEYIDELDIVLITGANLEHAWTNGNCKSESIREITIQFHPDLFSNVINRFQFQSIKDMFEKASTGLAFSDITKQKIKPLLMKLGNESNGFSSFMKFINIIYELSLDKAARILSSSAFAKSGDYIDSRRIKKVISYVQEHIKEPIRVEEVAEVAYMSEMAFSRFFKKRTGKTFVKYLNDMRLGMATRLLIDSTTSIAEISFDCGFNNLSNFNRLFKKSKGCTPKEFRESYFKKKIII